jgi:sugar O-acyltransferase (sialic acid O-acetyltransferase NeuD family)
MDVVIVGAGGHGRVVLEILRAAGKHRAVGFLDANSALVGTTISDLPVLGHLNALPKVRQKTKGAIIAIGDNRARMGYAGKMREAGFELVNAIHPSAVVSLSAKIGSNAVLAAGSIVGTGAVIGDSVIINTGAIVDHECDIGEAVHIAPAVALAGRVKIGAGAFVGIGARVIQCLSVGEYATIGAGAAVIRDVPANATVVGVPARVIKQNN